MVIAMAGLMHRATRLLRTRPEFRNLWLAGLTTQLGDWVGWVAVSVFTLQTGGGALDLAVVFCAHSLPSVIALPVAGRLLDRFDRRRALVVTSVVMAGLTAGMVVAAWFAALSWLQGLLVVRSVVQAFVSPAERAALPQLVDEDELLLANAFDASSWSVVLSLGMVLGGLLTGLGPVWALAIDAGSFGGAALLFARLPPLPPGQTRRPQGSEPPHPRAPTPSPRRLSFATFAKAPLATAAGAGWMIIALRVEGWLYPSVAFGVLHAIRGTGAGLGSVAAAVGTRWTHGWALLAATGFGGLLLLALSRDPILTAVGTAAWGVGAGGNWVLSNETQQRLAPNETLARVASKDTLSWTLAMCLGAFAVGYTTDAWSLTEMPLGVAVLVGGAVWAGGYFATASSSSSSSSAADDVDGHNQN